MRRRAGIWKSEWSANHRVVIMLTGGIVPVGKMNDEIVSGLDGEGAFLLPHC